MKKSVMVTFNVKDLCGMVNMELLASASIDEHGFVIVYYTVDNEYHEKEIEHLLNKLNHYTLTITVRDGNEIIEQSDTVH